MNLIGTIVRETSTAVLFRGDEPYDEVFEGREIWWPLSQVTLFRHGGAGYSKTGSERIVTSRWIAESKAQELGRSAELSNHYSRCEDLDREERRQKAARRASKAAAKSALTPETIAANIAAKAAAASQHAAHLKAAAEQAVAVRAAWEAMDEDARSDVYRRAGMPVGKNGAKWVAVESTFGPRFHKALSSKISSAAPVQQFQVEVAL